MCSICVTYSKTITNTKLAQVPAHRTTQEDGDMCRAFPIIS